MVAADSLAFLPSPATPRLRSPHPHDTHSSFTYATIDLPSSKVTCRTKGVGHGVRAATGCDHGLLSLMHGACPVPTCRHMPQARKPYSWEDTPVVAPTPVISPGMPAGVGGPRLQWPVGESDWPSNVACMNEEP